VLQTVEHLAAQTERRHWMALLARAPLPLLEQTLSERASTAPVWLRRPETGLFMVQGRIGGTGARFNVGEVTVTRCALRLRSDLAPMGVAYVMGRSHRHAHLAAIADALLQMDQERAFVQKELLDPVADLVAQEKARVQGKAQATRVNFFTVAREAGDSGAAGEELE
jgi:alpha-D-ribose 1-methylphosphonate 5-triphosphate synthase subunit PhnG